MRPKNYTITEKIPIAKKLRIGLFYSYVLKLLEFLILTV